MSLTPTEREKLEKFNTTYSTTDHPARLEAERAVLGTDYGANSYTTTQEARLLIDLASIDPSSNVLDVGCGAGYPGLYIAAATNCTTVLADMPEVGLRRAISRAQTDGVDAAIVQATATHLPLADGSFDVVIHSDVLC